jgi:simple sugar transport system ATP-binding protein
MAKNIEIKAASVIALSNIDKHFGTVHANKNVSLEINKASIHGIVGENGAGKSTLMSILFGFYHADSGAIFVHGQKTEIKSPQGAIHAGIGMVHQHFMLVDNFTVLENIILGCEGGAVLKAGLKKARLELERLARDYDLKVPLDEKIENLTVGQQQRVEILKALYRGAEILILDEPTAVLTPSEADHLFEILRHLKAQGKTIILITHKLREIMAITDRVSVMRQGEMIATFETEKISTEDLAEQMVGRRVLLQIKKSPAILGRAVLEVKNLVLKDEKNVTRLDGISFTVSAGEIVGIAGVAGNGQSELLEAIAGLRPWDAGAIILNGEPLSSARCNPRSLRKKHVAHVPEDRHRLGMVMAFGACENAVLGYQNDKRFGLGPFLSRSSIIGHTKQQMNAYDIRPCNPCLKSSLFSGGNQQKLILAREFGCDPELLIVGQPTRGVDIGAIEFIHNKLIALRDRGKAILLVSVELDEIRALSDRMLVMCAGRIMNECTPSTDEKNIGLMMTGIAIQEKVA